ncbi:MAG: DUF2384 domain-containing protein [Planctomycetes bacterium]|nr:DUF2384 domain-containing protein [Planctomycetota bacterium]
MAHPASRLDDDRPPHWYAALIGLPATHHLALVEKLRAGLPFKHLQKFAASIDLPWALVCPLVGLSTRTLERRRRTGRLSTAESDRLLATTRVVALALRLFGEQRDRARSWLLAPQRALGDATPLELAATDFGAREVEALIGRLEHGVFA